MALDLHPDFLIRNITVTNNDPRVAAHGRPGLPGGLIMWVDAQNSRAYLMIKHGDGPTDWEPIYSGTESPAGSVAPADLTAALIAAIAGVPTITVAAQAGTARAATIQLKDAALANLAAKAGARVWVSDAAAGAPAATAPDGGVAISGGVAIVTVVANKVFDVVSSAAGAIVVTLTDSGVGPTTWYVNVAIGNHVVSAAVAIAN